mgnify:CR=1 FL=1
MYKGSVVELGAVQPPPDAPLREKERYDPWESVVVQWDRGACLGRAVWLAGCGPCLTDCGLVCA